MRIKLCLAIVLLAFPLFAQHDHHGAKTPDQDAAMKAMIAAATPGEPHKGLATFAGTWNTKVKFYPAPGAPAMESTGLSESKMVLGGRYLEQRFTGTMMGAPMEGVGYTGYDNVKKEYWGTWIDNMSTGMMRTTGSSADGGKTWKFSGIFADPLTGKDTTFEEKITIVSNDEHIFEMWGPGPDGKNFKMMEITYTRKK